MCKNIKCHCQGGICVPKEQCHKKGSRCPPSTYCGIEGACLKEEKCMKSDHECPTDFDCDVGMGICISPRPYLPCTPGRDHECPSDFKCDHRKAICIPPRRIRCRKYNDCPSDFECAGEGICLPPRRIICKHHGDCSGGRLCHKKFRKCVLPTRCQRDRDCKEHQYYCDENNKCRPPCFQKSDCRSNEKCSSDKRCIVKQYCDIGFRPIRIPSHIVKIKPVCKKGQRCMNGICDIPECTNNKDCPRPGDFCKRDFTCGSFCRHDGECQPGQKCINGACRVLCSKFNDLDCPNDEICDIHNEGGICLPRRRCRFRSECPDRHVCGNPVHYRLRDTYCHTPKPCESSDHCKEYEKCRAFVCMLTESCEGDRDCPSKNCLHNYGLCKRVEDCLRTTDCGPHEFCNDKNICQKGKCRENSDCRGGIERCTSNGLCISPPKCKKDEGEFQSVLNIRIQTNIFSMLIF